MNINILDKFTANYKKTIESAYGISSACDKKEIEPIHILKAIIKYKGSLANEVLAKANIKSPKSMEIEQNSAQNNFERIITQKSRISAPESIKKILLKSVSMAAKYDHKYIGTEHLLHGLISSHDEKISKLLAKNNIKTSDLLKHLDIILNSTSHFPNMTRTITALKEKLDEKKKSNKLKQEKTILDFFAVCLTDQYIQKNINPVIGRTAEIDRVIQILSRKNKNNPILLGEPGVGKTAIVEGLAKKILEYDVPDILLNKKIYSMDIPMLVAGTSYRGEFEARIKQVIDEVKNNPNIILFIDEIHNIIGAGSVQGTMDAANILKPALSRGEIRCIGATTYDDFKKYIEPDTALTRRFQKIKINEPSAEEAIAIIKGIKKSFVQHHGVDISDEAIQHAVLLSQRYITDQFLPDKAIDLIDEASAQKKLSQPKNEGYKKLIQLEKQLEDIFLKKKELISKEKYKEALDIKIKELELINQIYKLEEQNIKNNITVKSSSAITASYVCQVTKADITALISKTTQINIPDSSQPQQNLKNLENDLNKKIIGQEKIIRELVNTLKRSAVGLAGEKRPLGSFIFSGPSAVGKTHTAKILAETFFPDKENLIRLDMSEFAEKFSASKLLGAPAGYVGYGDGGTLTEKIKRNPYSVILFDEIEKADPDLFNILLQILEDGHLTDSKGKNINFKNTIIIMTTNIGLKKSQEKESLGFGNASHESAENNFIENISNFLRPELLNRIDQILIFNTLSKQNIKKIINIELENINKNLNNQNLRIIWTKKIVDHLAQNYDQRQGARQVRKILREQIENPLAEKILQQKIKNNTASIEIKDNTIIIN
ncbi:MAG: ATP-dependent Clp protease ATP-binding subunit [Patescibacteria group bacterium]